VPEPNDPRHQLIDQGGPGLSVEKGMVEWVQARIQMLEDSREVNGLVFDPEVIPVDPDGEGGK
jgi:hypothetical protein